MTPEQRLAQLGISLPEPAKPVAAYVPAVRAGSFVFISGQGPFRDGELVYKGRIGEHLTEEDGLEAAKICALNGIAALKAEIGPLDQVVRIAKIIGWVNCTADFHGQSAVLNGASQLLVDVFGDKGRHARSAVSAHTLPLQMAVQLEMTVHVVG